MMDETSYFLFQAVLTASVMALIFYGVFFVKQKEKIRTIARLALFATGILLTLYILLRYLQAGYTPITSQHETIVFFAWSVTWAYLSFRWRYTVKNFGTFISLLIFILLLIAASASRTILPLPPALQSNWLPIHAGISVISYGFLALGFCSGVMYLLQERELKSKRFGYFFTRLPSLDSLDQLNSHCLATGFILFTLGIITGSIWAKQAWGTYWHWDPKETWSLITWFLYAAQIHQRFSAGWRGKRAAVMAVIGFAAVLFTLWGVTYLLGGVHSYAR